MTVIAALANKSGSTGLSIAMSTSCRQCFTTFPTATSNTMAFSTLLFVCLVGTGAASFHGERRAITSVKWNNAHLYLLGNEGDRFFSPNFAPLPPPSVPNRIKFDDQRATYDKKPSKYSKRGKLKTFKLVNLDDWATGYDVKSNVLGHYTGGQIYGLPSDDVKPVVEHIEGDIKYDFRTGTHSYD